MMWRVHVAGLTILALAALGLWLIEGWRQEGADALRDEIREAEEDLENEADAADAGLRACTASGGVWDFATSTCLEP